MQEFDDFEGRMYVNKQLEFIKLEEWGTLFEDFSYRLIARTPIGEVTINTVWTGVNMPFGTPFETGIFQGDTLIVEERHCTEEQAKDYHITMVMGYINKGFLEFLQKEHLCIQSLAPTAEQTLCDHSQTLKPLSSATIA
jgi:hypothetical protein